MPRAKIPATVAAIGLTKPAAPPGSDRLAVLVRTMEQRMDIVAMLERQLSEAKAALQDLAENVIPEAMEQEGVDAFTVPWQDGVVKLNESYHASITKLNKDEAYKWLEASGNTDVLKDQIIISFGLKEYAEATVCRRFITKEFPDAPVDVKRTVPGSTLVAFARRMLEAGANWPAELFGAYHKRTVVLPWRKPVKETTAETAED